MYIQRNPCYDYHREHFGDQASLGQGSHSSLYRSILIRHLGWTSKAGLSIFFPVAEHHDGFQMYASTLSPYNSLEMGQDEMFRRTEGGSRKRGLHFCTSSHRAEHQFFFFPFHHGKEFASDILQEVPRDSLPAQQEEPKDHFDLTSKPYPSKEFLEDWLLQTL